MIDTILIDLDNTILDFTTSERLSLEHTLKKLGAAPAPEILERYSKINDSLWKQLERGEITRETLKIRRFEQLFEETGILACPEEAQKLYQEELSQSAILLPGARDLLEELRKTCRLYLCTNGNADTQHGRIAAAGLEPYFADIFISEELQADKPSPEYFAKCFARIPDFIRENTVLIGDSLTSDIAGGKAAGLHTIWFSPDGADNPLPDETVRSLHDIIPCIRNIQ